MKIKKRIVISSTLKPVDDIRSFRKIGDSLGKTNNYDVKIIGYGSKKTSTNNNIELISTGVFGRLSLKRIFLPFKILGIIIKLKPDLLIISTHELLLSVFIIKVLNPSCKIVYDIRENYYANIRFQKIFPPIIKHLLANWVRFKEVVTAPFISHLLVAEMGYVQEIPFIKKRNHLVLENKSLYQGDRKSANKDNLEKIIFTGNLSVNSGVLKAIEIYRQIKLHLPYTTLLIIGHCPDKNFRQKLQAIVTNENDIVLKTDEEPISYQHIKSAIESADLAIVSYQINDSNINCIPTKVFEYLAHQLPFLCEKSSNWERIGKEVKMCFSYENDQINVTEMIEWYRTITFTYPINPFVWEEESQKLNDLVKKLILE
ncbi:MAG: hypothetical protein AAFQ94_16760 [Bacteroidota bacterium]